MFHCRKISPRKNKRYPLSSILYGAPDTGNTYTATKYALAILADRHVDDTPKTPEHSMV